MTTTDNEARQKVWDLIKEIKFALLVTQDEYGNLHARPMAAQQQHFEGVLWFFTWEDSPKVKEIARNPKVLISYAEPAKQEYVSVRGTAAVLRDQEKINELWHEALRTWFPKGPTDSKITLIRVAVENAEYWDSSSSMFVHLYGYIKARLTGEPATDMGENKKVAF